MDRALRSGYGAEAKDEAAEFRRVAHIRTDGGEAIRVSLLKLVTLGQAAVLVADGKVYGLEVV